MIAHAPMTTSTASATSANLPFCAGRLRRGHSCASQRGRFASRIVGHVMPAF
jgi:hypothetical protein